MFHVTFSCFSQVIDFQKNHRQRLTAFNREKVSYLDLVAAVMHREFQKWGPHYKM